jgi:transporter family-2 protein
MELLLLALLGLAAGAVLPVQASVNSSMGRALGRPEWAALVNFVVGAVGLACWLLVQRASPPGADQVARAPWWAWTGGLLGAFFVSVVVLLAPRLGVATTLALAVAGQMAAALLIDRQGWFGVVARPLDLGKVAGAALLVGGVVLLRR